MLHLQAEARNRVFCDALSVYRVGSRLIRPGHPDIRTFGHSDIESHDGLYYFIRGREKMLFSP